MTVDTTHAGFGRKLTVGWPTSMFSRKPNLLKFKLFIVALKTPYLLDLTHTDIFSLFDATELEKIRKDSNAYFFFEYFMEGTSYKWLNYYEAIERSAIKYAIPFNKIIYASSNLREHESYNEWCSKSNSSNAARFKILILNFWDGVFENQMDKNISIDQTVERLKKGHNKYFLCLNRRKRPFRLYSIFRLHQSNIFNKGAISCDKIKLSDFENLNWHLNNYFKVNLDLKEWFKFCKTTPLVLDSANFQTNWADTMPDNLFGDTLFSAVNETLIEEGWDPGPSLFYSEKTFKPMMYNHPILIFGQAGANARLKQLGYNTYEKYFDLSFDNDINPINRINGAIASMEKVCNTLDTLTLDSKIEWLLQDRETIEHNKQVLKSQTFNIRQVTDFFKVLEEER